MALSHLPACLTTAFAGMASCLHKCSAARLPLILSGILFASGRRTCTSWFRAAGITVEYRRAYNTLWAVGREVPLLAVHALAAAESVIPGSRLLAAIDDTPTPRYGRWVEGAGIHHNPSPGPAGEKHVYGHVWVSLAALARHPQRGTVALPLRGEMYIRQIDLPKIVPWDRPAFRTKLEMAAEQLHWLKIWAGDRFSQLWVAFDGAYAKRPVLKPARQLGIVVVSRLRKDAALYSLPGPQPASKRGPKPIYGKQRISLARRAAHPLGWQQVECVQYGQKVTKTIKTFLATWRPAGGKIRVVLVKEEDGWIPFFSTNPEATVVEILEAAADRSAHEQAFKDQKEVWGAGQQQVRNRHASVACFNVNGWLATLVEAWAWDKPQEELVDRSRCPWDSQPRRPSHADKRKALQREILSKEIDEALAGRPNKQRIRQLVQRLLDLAA
jgi:hypothetical protein